MPPPIDVPIRCIGLSARPAATSSCTQSTRLFHVCWSLGVHFAVKKLITIINLSPHSIKQQVNVNQTAQSTRHKTEINKQSENSGGRPHRNSQGAPPKLPLPAGGSGPRIQHMSPQPNGISIGVQPFWHSSWLRATDRQADTDTDTNTHRVAVA